MINPAWRHATPVLLALALVLPIAPAAAQEADLDRFVKTLLVQGVHVRFVGDCGNPCSSSCLVAMVLS